MRETKANGRPVSLTAAEISELLQEDGWTLGSVTAVQTSCQPNALTAMDFAGASVTVWAAENEDAKGEDAGLSLQALKAHKASHSDAEGF